MLKKIFVSLLLFLTLLTSFPGTILAQANSGEWYNQKPQEFFLKVYDTTTPSSEIFGERYTAAQVQWIYYSIPSILINLFVPTDVTTCIIRNEGNLIACSAELLGWFTYSPQYLLNQPLAQAGSYSAFGDSIKTYLQNNPLSGTRHIIDSFKIPGVIEEAKAQTPGFGFTALENPVRRLWRASRDITYGIFILVIIIYAFMIMFRTKINPQTAVSVQSALPKIIIALFLITFSYAIAGFMIDFTYVIIGIISAMFIQSGILTPGTTWNNVFGALTNGVFGMGALGWIINYVGFFSLSTVIVSLRIAFSLNTVMVAMGTIMFALYPIIIILVEIWLLIIAFRVLWMLIITYVRIILQVMIAPFAILVGSVSPMGGFGSWLRSLAAELAVYPVTGVMFMVSFIFLMGAIAGWDGIGIQIANLLPWGLNFNPDLFNASGGQVWDPPLTVGTGEGQPLLFLGASLAIMSMIPRTSEIIKGIISGRPFAYGTAIGESLAPFAWGYGQARPELGYRAARAGAGLQGPGSTAAQRAAGRILLGWGEPHAQVIRDRDTGVVKKVLRRGEAP